MKKHVWRKLRGEKFKKFRTGKSYCKNCGAILMFKGIVVRDDMTTLDLYLDPKKYEVLEDCDLEITRQVLEE